MIFTPEDLDEMAAAGITLAQLSIVQRIVMRRDGVGMPADIGPSKEALRARKYREKSRLKKLADPEPNRHDVSPTVTTPIVIEGDNKGESPFQGDSGKTRSPVSNARERRPASRIPEDFAPDATVEAIAREAHLTRRQWQDWLAEHIDFWKARPGKDGLKTDWQATARNSLRRHIRLGHHNNGVRANGTAQRNNIKESLARGGELFDRIMDREGETGRGPDLRLIPGLRQSS